MKTIHNLPLSAEAWIERLRASEAVLGLLVMGSTGTARFKPYSDYDLVILLEDLPPRLFAAFTRVGGTLGDFYFFYRAQIEELIEGSTPVDHHSVEAKLIDWLKHGEVLLDRAGLFARLKERAQREILVTSDPSEAYRAWYGINFNLAHNRRMFDSGDPHYRQTVEVRLLFCLMDILQGYFTLREWEWSGEKRAIQILAERDPAFLEAYFAAIRAADLEEKFARYEALANQTIQFYGHAWDERESAVLLRDEFTPEALTRGLEIFLQWLGDEARIEPIS